MKLTIENYQQAEMALRYVKEQIAAGGRYDQTNWCVEFGNECDTPCCIAGHLSIYRIGLERHKQLDSDEIVREALLAIGAPEEWALSVEDVGGKLPWLFYSGFDGGPKEVREAWESDRSEDKGDAALLAIDVFLSQYRDSLEREFSAEERFITA